MNMPLKTGIAIPLLLATTSLLVMAEDRATGGGAVSLVEAVATSRHSQGKLNGCEMTYLVAFGGPHLPPRRHYIASGRPLSMGVRE